MQKKILSTNFNRLTTAQSCEHLSLYNLSTFFRERQTSNVQNTRVESAKQNARQQLKSLSNSLMELAKSEGRTDVAINELLREAYQLVGKQLKTFEAWQSEGANIRRGQRAYLFWGAPVETEVGYRYCPVQYLFSQEQVRVAH